MSYDELIEVKWANDIAEVYIRRRPKNAGCDVYTVALNNIAFVRMTWPHETHEYVMQELTNLVNDEQKARAIFHYND